MPLACLAGANVAGTVLFKPSLLRAFAARARTGAACADRSADAGSRVLFRRFGAKPRVHRRRQPHGSGLGRLP